MKEGEVGRERMSIRLIHEALEDQSHVHTYTRTHVHTYTHDRVDCPMSLMSFSSSPSI